MVLLHLPLQPMLPWARNFRQRRFFKLLFCTILFFFSVITLRRRYSDEISYFMNEIPIPWAKNKWIPYSKRDLSSDTQFPFFKTCINTTVYKNMPYYHKMNATFLMLTRNEELDKVLHTIESIESHFNQWFNYPYVFLNDVAFTDEFKIAVQVATSSRVQFGTIGESEWEFPKDVRSNPAFRETLLDQGDRGILYGPVESYHKMCRFYSGIFYKHPLVRQYDWYWRLEPDVDFYCDITYDPFLEMERHGKRYGFVVLFPELYFTIPSLFRVTMAFIRKNGIRLGTLWKLFTKDYDVLITDDEYLSKWVYNENDVEYLFNEKLALEYLFHHTDSGGKIKVDDVDSRVALSFLVDRAKSNFPIYEDKFDNQEYNLCHFWTNFEIARRDVFDNEVYDAYFKFLEDSGGFWRERWGDAPVHSLGLCLTLNISEVHYFRDIGYRHSVLQHCPKNSASRVGYKEAEPRYRRSAFTRYDTPRDYGIGCRCNCPYKPDIEDTSYPCMDYWLRLAFGMEENFNFHDGAYHPYLNSSQLEQEYRDRIFGKHQNE